MAKHCDPLSIACAFDPIGFMRLAYGMAPDLWQTELLSSSPVKTLLLCSRQSGKSTVSAVMALHKAVFSPESLVLIISNVFRQAQETFRKVKEGVPFISALCGITYSTQTMLELSNGSRIVSLPGKQESIRSFSSVALLIIDEASQVTDELYRSVRPMLAVSRGKIIALTTPFGKRGWFYNAWASDNDWNKVRVTADDCPRITEEFLDEEKQEIGDWWVRQEYYCEFVDAEDQLFGHDLIIDAISSDIEAYVPMF